jgi:hypothetical protein
MSWFTRKAHTFADAARNGGQRAEKIVAQGIARARKSGVMTARKVINVQRAAGLNSKVVLRSARSVIGRPEPKPHQPQLRPADMAWTDAYRAVVANEVPEALEPARWSRLRPVPGRPQMDKEAGS